MPSLFLRCEKCSTEFPSGIAVTAPQALQTISMNGLRHKCPKCGAVGTYFTKDYYIPEGIEKIAGSPPDSASAEGAAAKEESMKLSGFGVGAQ